jgi:hypothetical protein
MTGGGGQEGVCKQPTLSLEPQRSPVDNWIFRSYTGSGRGQDGVRRGSGRGQDGGQDGVRRGSDGGQEGVRRGCASNRLFSLESQKSAVDNQIYLEVNLALALAHSHS